jgi:hypothetical protein
MVINGVALQLQALLVLESNDFLHASRHRVSTFDAL